jgi:tetratricopeptide (TPR) repeat protein
MAAPAELEVAHGLLQSARVRASKGHFDAGARLAERARELFFAADAVAPAFEAARIAAELRARCGDLAGARELHEWVVEEGDRAERFSDVAQARSELGSIAEATGDLHRAVQEHDSAYIAASRSERPDLVAMARGNLGRLLQRQGDLRAARAHLEAARDGFRSAGVASGAINAMICLGDLERQLGQLSAARTTFLGAVGAAHDIGHDRLEALASLNLGHAARDLGEREAAVVAFERASELAGPIAEPLVQGGARLGLGLVLADNGPADIAYQHFEAAEAIFLSFGNVQTAVAATVNAAAIACRMGRLNEGHRRMRKALTTLEEIGDTRGEHEVGLALAEVALAMGHVDETHSLLARYDEPAIFGPRMVRRQQLLETRLAARALQVDLAVSLLQARGADTAAPSAEQDSAGQDGAQQAELTAGESFALSMLRVEIGLLAGQRGVLDEAMSLAAGVEAHSAPREAAAAANIVGLVLLWLGELESALASFVHASSLWRRLGERIGLATALDGCARVQLLLGLSVELPELRELCDELRDGGATDSADGLALLIGVAQHAEAMQRGELPEELGVAADTLARRARRGNRLAVWADLHLIARVLEDDDAAEEAAELARASSPAAPMWAWPVESAPS